ncbi:MAG: hypothetical protein R6W02_01295 [Halomonas campaniensis]
MELREWLIILGLALVTLIVVDGVRRLQRQRKVPRLDEVADDAGGTDLDPDEAARAAELNWELPNGGARVVRPADYSRVQPKPKLERQEHPGASRVLASFREAREPVAASADRVGKPQAREVAGQEEHARQPDMRVERSKMMRSGNESRIFLQRQAGSASPGSLSRKESFSCKEWRKTMNPGNGPETWRKIRWAWLQSSIKSKSLPPRFGISIRPFRY